MQAAHTRPLTAVILAGGSGSRMGGRDKGLMPLNGRPMIEYVIDAVRPQVDAVVISANRNPQHYRRYGYPVLADLSAEHAGPLAGVASALQACRGERLLSVPCDCPFIPSPLVGRLGRALDAQCSDVSVAGDGRRPQPVFAMLRVSLLPALLAYLDAGHRKAISFYSACAMSVVDCSDWPGAFININTPEELAVAEQTLSDISRAEHPPR
jgi:molybdenum cofactor guanylyltransferase